MKVTLLEAKIALSKELGVWDESAGKVIDKAYPNAKNFKTHTRDINNIDEYADLIRFGASNFFGLLKGTAERELPDWSDRKGLTERSSKTRLVILDIDGLPYQIANNDKLTDADVKKAAEWFVEKLPPCYREASYVAVASSNFGRKAGLRMHLHFISKTPIAPEVLRGLITELNFNVKYIEDNLTLTGSGRQLRLPVDPCLADNSRLIFIAPPLFPTTGENPFKRDADRIVLVKKVRNELDLEEEIAAFRQDALIKKKEKRLKAVMAAHGIEYVKVKTRTMMVGRQSMQVIANPDQCKLEFAYADRGFVYYNKDGGDSNAYWVRLDSPEVVHSFKPDETPFSFKESDPDTYAWHMENFAKEIIEAQAIEGADGYKFVPMMFIERERNSFMTVEYDPFNDSIKRMAANTETIAKEWVKELGLQPPEPVPSYTITFDPTRPFGVSAKEKLINTYAMPEQVKQAPVFEGDPLTFGEAEEWMLANTPIIYTVMMNMLGDDHKCLEHFINWFAWMVQKREKPETAWVVHGVEGTGKGLFIKRIAKPLLGSEYVVEKRLADIVDDKYNGYMAECLLLFVDEFNMNSGSSNAKKAVNDLKLLITQDTINIRRMHQNPTQAKNFFGMMFASNDIDSFRASSSDRRYNVCPRQERPLIQVIPDLNQRRKHYDELIETEIPKLASMLMAYDILEDRVRIPMDNEAKALAREAGEGAEEMFFNALRHGRLDFFEELAIGRASSDIDLVEASHFKKLVESWFVDCLAGTKSKIKKQDLYDLYKHMTKLRTVNEINFGKKAKQHLREEKQFREGLFRFRGFEIGWQYDDMDGLREYVENRSKNNVVAMKKG